MTNLNAPVGALKLNPVPEAGVVVIRFGVGFTATVDPNDGKALPIVVVGPNVTPVVTGLDNPPKFKPVADVVAGCCPIVAVAPNVGNVVCVTVGKPKLPNAGG